jgi:lipopolysaccharide export system permease protein
MAGRSEVIAILSSGISFNRYMRPFMIGGLLMSLMLWIGYQSIVPKANLKWAEFEKNYIKVNSKGGKKSSYMQNLYFKETKNSWVGIKGYDTLTRVGNNFSLSEFKDEVMVKNMRAAGFRWDSSEKKWLFNNVVIRTFNGDTESVSYQHSYIATMNFQPIDLRKDEYLKDQMTTKELRQFIRKEKERGSEMINSLLVEKHNRTAIPASVFILTIIGSVLASKKVRGGSGIHLALGVIISVTYILFSRLSIVFATQGNFPPVLAAWFPNILFGIVAIYLYSKAQK